MNTLANPGRFGSGRFNAGRFSAKFGEGGPIEGGIVFGALTRAGAGGVPAPNGATAITGGTANGYMVNGGYVVPVADGSADSGTLEFAGSTGQWTVVAISNTFSTRCANAEIAAALAVSDLTGNQRILVRDGANETNGYLTIAQSFSGTMLIEAEGFATNGAAKPDGFTYPARLQGVVFNGVRNLTLKGFDIAVRGDDSWHQPNYGILNFLNGGAGVTIDSCQLRSTPMHEIVDFFASTNYATVFPHQVLEGVQHISGDDPSGLTIQHCYTHDLNITARISCPNFVFQGNFSEDNYGGWVTISAPGYVLQNNEFIHIWASQIDPGDPHSGLGGGDPQLGLTVSGINRGNVLSVGWRRTDYDGGDLRGTTGHKLNDPVESTSYSGEYAHNLVITGNSQSFVLGGSEDFSWHHNTSVCEGLQNVTIPGPVLGEMGHAAVRGFKGWNNVTSVMSMSNNQPDPNTYMDWSNNAFVHRDAYAGLEDISQTHAYEHYFTGHPTKGFSRLTIDEAIAAFTPQSWTYAAQAGLGAVNAHYPLGIAGLGATDTSPDFAPANASGSSTATGYVYPATRWSGQSGLVIEPGASGTRLDGASNGRRFTVLLAIAPSDDTDEITLIDTNPGSLLMVRNANGNTKKNRLNVSFRDGSNRVIGYFETTYRLEDGQWEYIALSVDLYDDKVLLAVNGVEDTAFTALNAMTLANANIRFAQAQDWNLLQSRFSANRFSGDLKCLVFDDSFVDLASTAGIEQIFAADGSFVDFRYRNYLICVQGDAAAINAGIANLSADGQHFVIEGQPVVDTPPPSVPALIADTQWSAVTSIGASRIVIDLMTLPDDNGANLTQLQYSVDGGLSWSALGGMAIGTRVIDQHSDGSTGTLTPDTSYDLRLRALNAIGTGPASGTKATTSGAVATGNIVLDPGFSINSYWVGTLPGNPEVTAGHGRFLEGTQGYRLRTSPGYRPKPVVGGGSYLMRLDIISAPAGARARIAMQSYSGPSALPDAVFINGPTIVPVVAGQPLEFTFQSHPDADEVDWYMECFDIAGEDVVIDNLWIEPL
ncbi:MAG: hypothetical protein AB8B51_00450 [Sedimentitalea sp.]